MASVSRRHQCSQCSPFVLHIASCLETRQSVSQRTAIFVSLEQERQQYDPLSPLVWLLISTSR